MQFIRKARNSPWNLLIALPLVQKDLEDFLSWMSMTRFGLALVVYVKSLLDLTTLLRVMNFVRNSFFVDHFEGTH